MFKPIEQANEIILQLLLDNCTNTFEYVWKNFGVEYARTITWFLIDYNCLCFGEFGQGYVVSLLGFLIANACLRFKV